MFNPNFVMLGKVKNSFENNWNIIDWIEQALAELGRAQVIVEVVVKLKFNY